MSSITVQNVKAKEQGENMIANEILTRTQLKKIAEIINRCQDCGKKCTPEPHRIVRGYQDGKYILRNLYFLCNPCHKRRHEMERMGRK